MSITQSVDHITRNVRLLPLEVQQVAVIGRKDFGQTRERITTGGHTTAFAVEFPNGERETFSVAWITVVSDISIPQFPTGGGTVVWPRRWHAGRVGA